MWVCTSSLKESLALLRHYLDGLDHQDLLQALSAEDCGVAGEAIQKIKDHFRTKHNKAQYDYNTAIISLYGYLERFIEDLVSEYLTLISSLVLVYGDLPAAIRDNHFPVSLELARKADYQRYMLTVRVEDIVARLHACYSSPTNYQLNIKAFTLHTANFRHATVTDMFAKAGMENIGHSLRHTEPFRAFLLLEDPERDADMYLAGGDGVIFGRLDDLANRRNDVSHGTPVEDILSRELLRSLIDFVEAYADGLSVAVYERTLPFQLAQATLLGNAIQVINHRIVCVELGTGQISVGDTLIAKTQDASRPYKAGPIKEVQQNHLSLATIVGGPGVQIGMLVDFGAKIGHEFYHLRAAASPPGAPA